MSFPLVVQLNYGMEKDFGTDKLHPLGTAGITPDGRRYKYCLAGGTALDPALLNAYLTTATEETAVTVAHPVGTEVLTVDAITTLVYEDGYLIVSQGTGIGEIYQIKSNTATKITLNPGDGLKTAWSTTDTDIEMFRNPYTLLVVNPLDARQKPVCVANCTITGSNYFWGQVAGFCALKIEGTVGLLLDEKALLCATGTNGEAKVVDPSAGTNYFGHHIVGYLVEEANVGADSDAALAFLQLD